MNDTADLPLSITEDQLFAIIGRLHVENLALRAQLAALRSGAIGVSDGAATTGSSSPPLGHTTNIASPNE